MIALDAVDNQTWQVAAAAADDDDDDDDDDTGDYDGEGAKFAFLLLWKNRRPSRQCRLTVIANACYKTVIELSVIGLGQN